MSRASVCLQALVLTLSTGAAAMAAQSDGVYAPDILSDADLYRMVTCGAAPGGPCRRPAVRWDRPVLTLTVASGADPLPEGFAMPLVQAAVRAVDQINAAGAGIRIVLVPTGPADITIRPTALPEGSLLAEVPGFSGPGVMGVGYTTVWSGRADNVITEAVILISTGITSVDLTSVVLEEVTQSLGLIFDIDGPAYEGVSILSQTSNATTVIAGQDAALLRLHYPPG